MAGDLPSPSSALPHSLLDDLNCEEDVEPAPGLPRPRVADKHLSSECLQNLSTYDEWEWKTSAKDFKPSTDAGGTFSSSGSTFGGSHSHSGFCRSPLLGPSTGSSTTESPSLDPRSQSWTVPPMSMAADFPLGALDLSGCLEDFEMDTEEYQAHHEEHLRFMLQAKIQGLEQKRERMQAQWEMERKQFITHIACCRAVLQRYSVPLEEADAMVKKLCAKASAEEEMSTNQSWNEEAWRHEPAWLPDGGLLSDGMDMNADIGRPPGIETDASGCAETIACTLKALFPHAKVRAGSEDDAAAGPEKEEVEKRVQLLQESTQSEIDERALSSLWSLSASKAMEVLQRVEELVEAQGGACRNLSSMLQSVCRKMERKMIADAKAKAAEGEAGDDAARKHKQDDGKEEYWTVKRIERIAEQCFETWYEADRWRLKLSMSGSDLASCDVAMERFCAWLRRRLADFKDTHGAKVLRQCQGEVDFSYSGLSDHGFWLLLDCLSQFEVQAAFLKLTHNRITRAGVQSLCEFIRNNKRAGQIYEMHLAENQIDDDGALELMQTMKELKHRYPPKREIYGKSGLQLVPVWLQLARNKINAAALLKSLSVEGISWCGARQGSGCTRTQCPLVQFDLDQDEEDTRRPGRSGRRGHRGEDAW